MKNLRSPPRVKIEVVGERPGRHGVLLLRRWNVRAQVARNGPSVPFAYDLVDRVKLDAVVVVAHHVQGGERCVYLRSITRPPVALRRTPPRSDGGLWEVPAGLIDEGETPRRAAARELAEELGFVVPARTLQPLGPWAFPAPSMIGERHVFFHVEVDPARRKPPREDGSVLESHGVIEELSLRDALRAAREGRLRDEKTELALRRLAEMV